MNDDLTRIGQAVTVTDAKDGEKLVGLVESGHAHEYMVRAHDGELTGPWRAEELSRDGVAKVVLRIENRYEGDVMVETRVVTVVPLPMPSKADEHGREEWEYEYIYQHTGTGREDGDSWYDVEIADASTPHLIGLQFEFGY